MALSGVLAGIVWAVIGAVLIGILGLAILPVGRGGIILFIVLSFLYGFLGLIIGVLAAAMGVRDYFNAAWLGVVVAGLPQVVLMLLSRGLSFFNLIFAIVIGVLIGETCIWLFRMFFRRAWELYE